MKLLSRVLMVVGLGMLISMLYLAGRLTGWNIPVAIGLYGLAWGVQMIVHEVGHWIGGTISGYRLLLLQLGILGVEKTGEGKLRLIRAEGLTGQCIMIPQKTEDPPFRAYHMGGMTANLLLVLISCCFVLIPWFYGQLLFVSLLWTGVQKILINSLPDISGGYPNDGYVLWLLAKYPEARKDHALYLQLYEKLYREEPIEKAAYTYERNGAEPEALLYYREMQDILDSLPETAEI